VSHKFASNKGPMPGKFRVGGWYEGNPKNQFTDTLGGRRETGTRAGDTGWYIGADQMVWKENADEKDVQGLGLFMRYGHAHQDVSRITNYWALGASYKGLIPERDKDVFGFAVAQSILSERYGDEIRALADRETSYEWYYLYQATPWCTVSPHLQVVSNPGGDKFSHDAIIGGIRVRVTF